MSFLLTKQSPGYPIQTSQSGRKICWTEYQTKEQKCSIKLKEDIRKILIWFIIQNNELETKHLQYPKMNTWTWILQKEICYLKASFCYGKLIIGKHKVCMCNINFIPYICEMWACFQTTCWTIEIPPLTFSALTSCHCCALTDFSLHCHSHSVLQIGVRMCFVLCLHVYTGGSNCHLLPWPYWSFSAWYQLSFYSTKLSKYCWLGHCGHTF